MLSQSAITLVSIHANASLWPLPVTISINTTAGPGAGFGPRLQDPATISPAIGATRINQSSSLDLPTAPECLVSKLAPSLWLSRHLPTDSPSCYFLSGINKVLLYVRVRFPSCLRCPTCPRIPVLFNHLQYVF